MYVDAVGAEQQSPQERMDGLLNGAFYQALKTTASAKKIEFPILTSNFFRQCTILSLPSGISFHFVFYFIF